MMDAAVAQQRPPVGEGLAGMRLGGMRGHS